MEFNWLLILCFLIYFFKTSNTFYSSGFETIHGKSVSDIKFPIVLKIPVTSDIIFIKCPGNKYVHEKENVIFTSDTSYQSTSIYIPLDNDKIRLYVINLKTFKKDITQIVCGRLHLSDKNYSILWLYKLEFTSKPEVINNEIVFEDFDKLDTDCENYSNRTANYYKISNEMIIEGLPKISEIVKDTIIYSLPLVGLEKSNEIIVPCKISRVVSVKPTIVLEGYEKLPILENKNRIYFVKKAFGKSFEYKPILIVPSHKDKSKFYSKEKISVSQIKYIRNKTLENGEKKNLKQRKVSIYSYGIYEMTYFCTNCLGGNLETSTIFFFGPEEDNQIYEEKFNNYLIGALNEYPHCLLNSFSFAYLSKISFENESVNIEKLSNFINVNGFILEKDSVKYVKEKNPNGTLICTYQTPGVRILIKNNFNPKNVKLYDNENNELIYIEKNDNNNLYQKMEFLTKLKLNSNLYIKILVGFIVFILLLSIPISLTILYFHRNKFKNFVLHCRMKKYFPNIYSWWVLLNQSNLIEYSMVINDESYMPAKKDDKSSSSSYELYSNTIHLPMARKVYIWADGPSEDKVNSFWEMLYNMNIVVVLAIIYHNRRKEDYNVMNYCPKKKGSHIFGDISVELIQPYYPRSPQTVGLVYQMTNKEGKIKYVTILHFSGWQIHKLPEHIHHTFNPLFEEIKTLVSNRHGRVLFHNSHEPDSRIFTFTFFSLMVEIMEGEDGTDEPMDIVEDVRRIVDECYISSLEYILIQSALVEYFYNRGILIGMKKRILFLERYRRYLFNIYSLETDMNPEIKEFLWFCRIMDVGKLRNICSQIKRISLLDPQKLKEKCTRFYKILNLPDRCGKIRDHLKPCFDAYSIDCGDEPLDLNNYKTFLNANAFNYKLSYDEEQRIILCQAPTPDTLNGVIDMLFRQNVCVVAYFPIIKDSYIGINDHFISNDLKIKYGDYKISWKCNTVKIDSGITYRHLDISNSSNKNLSIKFIQYENWKEKNVPDDFQSFLTFYKEVLKSANKKPIVIMCEDGVVRSGVLALVIYMIDTIRPERPFHPIKDLAFLRKHRYGVINTIEQFVFVLGIVCEYHKSSIEKMCEETYCNYMVTVKKYLEKN